MVVKYINTSPLKRNRSNAKEYVAFIDIMGTQNCMKMSFERAANHIMRLHCCVTDVTQAINAAVHASDQKVIKVYPIMDGVYLTSPDFKLIRQAVSRIFKEIVFSQVNTKDNEIIFLVRGAIARGDIVHGMYITDQVCPDLSANEPYKNMLLFGLPMIQAYESEHSAPPMGIYIHESARSLQGFQGRFLSWWWTKKSKKRPRVAAAIGDRLTSYFGWCQKHSYSLKMDEKKIKQYLGQIQDYFYK